MISARDIKTKRCGKTILVTYRGEIAGMYPVDTPLTVITEKCHKMHSRTTIE